MIPPPSVFPGQTYGQVSTETNGQAGKYTDYAETERERERERERNRQNCFNNDM